MSNRSNKLGPVPREAVATPEQVREALYLSPEQLDKVTKQRDKALELFRSRARLTTRERTLGYAIEMEQHYRKTGNNNCLAEALALQGRYDEALEVADHPGLIKDLEEKRDAIVRDDADCVCAPYEREGDMFIPVQHVQAYVYSEKHGDIMPAIRCRTCGQLNVRPLLPHLAEQQAARHDTKEISAAEFFRHER